jgi:hypothetical protein
MSFSSVARALAAVQGQTFSSAGAGVGAGAAARAAVAAMQARTRPSMVSGQNI